jgi:hypothetical protein
MRITKHSFCVGVTVLAAVAFAGCGNNSTQEASKSTPGSPPPIAHDKDGHDDHDDHGHGEHGHPSEGPHHGHLIELGNEEYHAELLHDDDTHTVTIFILDSSAENEVAIPENGVTLNVVVAGKPTQFKMTPVGAANEIASQFQVVSEELHEALEGDGDMNGRLNATIDGKPYVGRIEHHSHEDDDHEHGH